MKKIISIITLSCFILSSVLGDALLAAADTRADSDTLNRALEGFLIPPACGRVTESAIISENAPHLPLVINIQDLHCHPEVQRNISKILSALDNKYGLDKIYVEGGYGDISTSWLCGIQDKELRQEIAENLIDSGRLTGSEYYSATAGRPDLLKGIEDESLHRQNIIRLGAILEKEERFKSIITELERGLEFMEAKHLGPKGRKFNDIVAKYKRGGINSDKYYQILSGYAHGINMSGYDNFTGYLELLRLGGKIKYKRIPQQLRLFMQALKSRVSFDVYNSLLDNTGNFSKQDELYIYLARLSKSPLLQDYKSRFKDLYLFFDYVEKNQTVNPVKLIEEEKRLTEEIRISLCRDASEAEVSFLADFFCYFRDYLLNRLSADDYAYFNRRFEKFRKIWGKYAAKNRIDELSGDFETLNEYYNINSKRNEIFLNNIRELGNIARGTEAAPEVVVMVTGGFHTAGIKEILARRNISYLAITPNVTKDSGNARNIYDTLARRQAELLSNSLALGLASELSSPALFALAIEAANKRLKSIPAHGRGKLVEEIEKSVGVKATYDATNGIIQFDTGARIKLEQTDGHLKATGITPARFISDAAKASIEALINTQQLAADILRGDTLAVLEKILKLAAEHHLISGHGLIHDIATDPELMQKLEDIELLAELPEPIQQAIATRGRSQLDNLSGAAPSPEYQDIPVNGKILNEVLSLYDIGNEVIESKTLKDNVFSITTEKGSFILKKPLYRNKKNLLDYEMSVIAAFRKYKIQTAGIIPTRSGRHFCNLEDTTYVLYENIPGRVMDWGEVVGIELELTAKTLAKIHNALRDLIPGGREYAEDEAPPVIGINNMDRRLGKLELLLDTLSLRGPPLSKVEKLCLDNQKEIRRQIEAIRRNITPEIISRLPQTIIHGDYHLGNLIFGARQGDGKIAVIDLEYARKDARIRDLANGCINKYYEDGTSINAENIRQFLAFYNAATDVPLTSEELSILPHIYRLWYLEVILLNLEKFSDDALYPRAAGITSHQIVNIRLIDSLDWNYIIDNGQNNNANLTKTSSGNWGRSQFVNLSWAVPSPIIVIVGMGRWGRNVLLKNLVSIIPENMRIFGVARSNYHELVNNRNITEQTTLITPETYQQSLLHSPHVKAIIIATQYPLHYMLAKQALEAGKHVFIEKPITRTRQEAEDLIRIANKNGKQIAVGYEYIHNPYIHSFSKALPAAGTIREIEMYFENLPIQERFDTSTSVAEDLAGHMFSVLHIFFGKIDDKQIVNLQSVQGVDKAQIGFSYKQIPIYLSLSRKSREERRKIVVKGSKLIITFDFRKNIFEVKDTLGQNIQPDNPLFPGALKQQVLNANPVKDEIQSFLDSIISGANMPNSATEVLWISAVLDRLKYSSILSNYLAWLAEYVTLKDVQLMLTGKPIETPFSIEIHPYFQSQPRPCNNNCIWCTRGEDKYNLRNQNIRGIEPKKLIALIKTLKTMGVQRVLFSGNSTEPLLYPDIDKIVSVVKEAGLSLKIFSNFYYGEKLLGVAKELNEGDTVRISLDAGGEYAYNMTHKPTDTKAFAKILSNIENLSKKRDENGNQFEIAIAFLITNLNSNKDDLEFILDWARENKINDIRFSFPLIPKVGYADFNKSMLLDDKEAGEARRIIENFKSKYPEYAKAINFRELDPAQPDKPFRNCHIWKLIPVLGASGRFFPCTSVSLVETMDDSGRDDINREDFNFITFWKDPGKWKHLDPQKCANGKCSDCTVFEYEVNKRIEEELQKSNGFLGVGKQALAAAVDAVRVSLGVKFDTDLQLFVSRLLQQAQGQMKETGRTAEYDRGRISAVNEPAAQLLDYFNRLRANEGKAQITGIIFKEYGTNYIATNNGLGLARIETFEPGTLRIDTAKFTGDAELVARLGHEIAEELALNVPGSSHYKALDYFLGKNHKARSDIPASELFEYWHACEKNISANPREYEALAITPEEKADITHLTAHIRADVEHLDKSIPTISQAIADLLSDVSPTAALYHKSATIATTIQQHLTSYLAILTPSPISRERISRAVVVNGQAIEIREAGDSTIDISVYPTPTKVDSVQDYLRENGFAPSDGMYIGNQTNSLKERDGILVTIKGLNVLAVDGGQNSVVEGARPIGKGIEATQKELERIINLPDEELPKFIALDIDGTLVDKKTVVINNAKKSVYENILEDRKELAFALAKLYERGVCLSFFTDSNSKNANANVLEPLTKIISERPGADGNPIYFYANGQSTKIILSNTGGKWERKMDTSYKKEAKISKENAALIMKILGSIEEDEQGRITAKGLLGNYYANRLAQKAPDGKYVIRQHVKDKFTKISFGLTKNGNTGFPSIQVRDGMPDGTVPQLAVTPLASGLNVAESEDLRAGLVKELADALEKAASAKTAEKHAAAPEESIFARLLQKAAALFGRKSVFDTPADVLVIGGGSGTNKIIEMFKTHFKCNAQSIISFIDNGGSSKDIMDDIAAAWLEEGYAPKPARDAIRTSTIPHPGDIMNSITGGIDEEWKRWLCNGRANDAATFEELLDKVKIQCAEKYRGRVDEKEINSFVEMLRPYFKHVDKKWQGKIRVEGRGHSIKNIIFLACIDAEHACPAGWVVPKKYNKALERAMAIVGSNVVSLPASPLTFRDIRFIATLSDGNKLEGQEEITSVLHDCNTVEKAGFYDAQGNPVKVKASPQVISMIRNAKKIIIGPGSAFSSVLVNLMAEGVVEELAAAKRRGVEIVFLFNTTQDVETMNHTPKSLMEALEYSINESLGIQCSFGDFVTHVVFNRPLEDDPLLKQFLDGEGRVIDEISLDTSRRPLEIGKHALDTFNISEDDLAYFENKGISPLVGRFAAISETGQSRKAGDKKAVSQYHYTLPLLAFLFSLSGKVKPSRAHYIAASVGEATRSPDGEAVKSLMREIATYVRNGNKYSILSGNTMRVAEERIISELKKELEDDDLLVNVPVVANNGAELWLYDKEAGKYVLQQAVDMQKEIGERANPGKVTAIVSEALKLFGPGIGNRGPYVEMRSVNYRGSDITTQITFYPFGKNLTDEERKNLDLSESRQIRDTCAGYLNERFSREGIRLYAAVHGKTSIDILTAGVDKAYGIGLLAKHFGVEPGEFIYFGSAFGAGEIDAPVESKAGMLVNLGKGQAKNPKALNFTLENAGAEGLARFISVINLIDETISRARARERSLSHSSTYDLGSGFIQGLASFLSLFGREPAILRDPYFIMRFSEIVAVIFNPLDLPFHARDNLNDYQKWGVNLVALMTTATIFSYAYILHASFGFTLLAAAAAYSLSHPLYNILFGTGTPANSPLATGGKNEKEMTPPVKKLIKKAEKNSISISTIEYVNTNTSVSNVLVDYHYLSPADIDDTIRSFNAATADATGKLHLNIFVTNEKTAEMKNWDWKPVGINVWASTTPGALVVFADNVDLQSIAGAVNDTITDKSGIRAGNRVTARVKSFYKSLGVDMGSKEFKEGITVDWTTDDNNITRTSGGALKVGGKYFTDAGGEIDEIRLPAMLGDIMAAQNADGVVMAQCNSLHLDIDVNTGRENIKDKIIENIRTFEKTGNNRLIIDEALVAMLGTETSQSIAELAKNSNIKICINLLQENPAGSDRYVKMGFKEYCRSKGKAFIIHCLDGTSEVSDIISGYGNDAPLLRQLYHESSNINKTLKLSELTALLRGGERDITEAIGITGMFRTSILQLYNPAVIDAACVRKAAHAMPAENLRLTETATDKLINAAAAGDSTLTSAVRDANIGCISLYMEKIAHELKSAGRENETASLQTEFAKAAVARILAVGRLEGAELADHELEIILGGKLFEQKLASAEPAGVSITADDFVRRNDVPALAFYGRLNAAIEGLCARPEHVAINTAIELIIKLAERKAPKGPLKKQKLLNTHEVTKLLKNA